ncbi:mitochondrial presequence protease [Nadsonia fulvescens var. elongata DSM 6958]|uniref:Presequence protease, mitochondrial n=1 Tax=Nadsonia fulvescens var. elongata DSM 6958 TaxID=857566 RepID=A0A1E3PCV1_9ASCO|nr:mitochondrial presequence protease [Nadsonia fulvescens var. elongata DSM 6958]
MTVQTLLKGARASSKHSLRRMMSSITTKYPVGSNLNGFTIKRTKNVPEFELTAVELEHDRTGAQHLHIDRDDKNNVFSIGFKTNPPNATGVPHILEHTTLCGSDKYQVRDPFFKMLNRSLANFMNAMTAQDYTFYPFATTNRVDCANLRDVYLDATLNPLLRENDFNQEGWRLESQDPTDPESPLTFKGVVYNEMKGQVSNASYLYYIKFYEHIYPSLNNSGGDPTKITDLTYPELVDFHHTNYHPSNSRIFTYGNFPLEDHLRDIDSKFAKFKAKKHNHEPKMPVNLTGSQNVVLTGPIDPMTDPSRQHKTSVSWYAGSPTDVYETFCVKVLMDLLMDGHASPLYQALIDTNLGSDFSPNTGVDSSHAISIVSVGLQGVTEADVPKIKSVILEVLEQASKNGFEQKRVDALIHQMELGKKDKKADFGMSILYSVKSGWFNKVDPMSTLEFDKIIERFNADMAKGGFLEGLIKKHFLGDKPSFTFTMTPSETYEADLVKEEVERLALKITNLRPDDKKKIHKRGLELLAKQGDVEDLSSLPTLNVSDISRLADVVPLEFSTVTSGFDSVPTPVQWRIAPTNGLTYFRGLTSLNHIPKELLPFVPLFTDSLTNLGTTEKNMSELESEIKLNTGGISFSVNVTATPQNPDNISIDLLLSSSALDKNVDNMFKLTSELLKKADFDNLGKLRSMISGIAASSTDSLSQSGHSFALTFSGSSLSPAKRINELFSGVEQVRFISTLAAMTEAELAENVVPKLKELARLALSSNNIDVAITCGSESVSSNTKSLESFISQLPENITSSQIKPYFTDVSLSPRANTLFELPFQVNYTAASLRGVPYIHKDGAALQVLSNMLTHKYLHGEIREKGGAYGGGANYSAIEGIFNYYSYRDPNPSNTISTISNTGPWALNNEWTSRDLEEAKLSIFQRVDAPISVKSEGMVQFLSGISNEMRQTRRERLLDVKVEDINYAIEKYLLAQNNQELKTTILGPKKDFMTPENGWTIIGGPA